MFPIEGNRWVRSPPNTYYVSVVNANNHVAEMLNLLTVDNLLNASKRNLQKAINDLYTPASKSGGKTDRTFIDLLSGKEGRFRRNLLGKRADYSARSVIVSGGADLWLNQCGLPKEIALELYKPILFAQIIKQGRDNGQNINVAIARRMVENRDSEIWVPLEKAVAKHPIILNRQPTLHRHGLLAFNPVLTEDKCIKLHPLWCSGYNADFDGDQMAIHLALSSQAIWEANNILLASKNLFNPGTGKPALGFNQDTVLGIYWLTSVLDDDKSYVSNLMKTENPSFVEAKHEFIVAEEIIEAYNARNLGLRDPVKLWHKDEKEGWSSYITTAGRQIFNAACPKDYDYCESILGETLVGLTGDDVITVVDEVIREQPNEIATRFCDDLLRLGLEYSTQSGISMSIADLDIFDEAKVQINLDISKAETAISDSQQDFRDRNNEKLLTTLFGPYLEQIKGRLSSGEEAAHDFAIKEWTNVKTKASGYLKEALNANPENSLSLMINSGARGNLNQVTQIAGYIGLVINSSNEIQNTPIKTCHLDGLTESDYAQAAPSTRKGQIDQAMKTKDAGYLTRKLVNVAHDVIVTQQLHNDDPNDCGTTEGILMVDTSGSKGNYIDPRDPDKRTLFEKVRGRVSLANIKTDKGIIKIPSGTLLGLEHKHIIDEIPALKVRSVFECNSVDGVCANCYGKDLSTNKLVTDGTAVGVLAAQSIGEPGLQLTMNTFHSGVSSDSEDITGSLKYVDQLFKMQKSVAAKIDIPNNGIKRAAELLLKEISGVYLMQGLMIDSKHFEVLIRQMFQVSVVIDPGSSNLLPGELIHRTVLFRLNEKLLKEGKKMVQTERRLESIVKITADLNPSWMHRASFQSTGKTIVSSALKKSIEDMTGMVPRISAGYLIRSGTGYNRVKQFPDQELTLRARMFKEIRESRQ